jgi:hypothetical protein
VLDGVGCVDLWRYVLGWLGVKGKVSAGAKVLLKTLPGKKKKENNHLKIHTHNLYNSLSFF